MKEATMGEEVIGREAIMVFESSPNISYVKISNFQFITVVDIEFGCIPIILGL